MKRKKKKAEKYNKVLVVGWLGGLVGTKVDLRDCLVQPNNHFYQTKCINNYVKIGLNKAFFHLRAKILYHPIFVWTLM